MPRKKIDQNDPIEVANSKPIEEFIEDYLPPRYVPNNDLKVPQPLLRNPPQSSLTKVVYFHFKT